MWPAESEALFRWRRGSRGVCSHVHTIYAVSCRRAVDELVSRTWSVLPVKKLSTVSGDLASWQSGQCLLADLVSSGTEATSPNPILAR
jgi:hypothetical protein